jgi:hypothetical protein
VLLLRAVALVAPVPLWEDVGMDAVGTLLRPEGGRRLIPEDTFGVQFKASSVRSIPYKNPDEARWVVNLGLPLFIGSVRLVEAAVDLYCTHGLFRVTSHAGLKEVHLHLDPHADVHLGSPEVADVYLGSPVLSWSADDLADRGFLARAYPVLKGHIQAAQRSIQGRPIGHFESIKWQTGQPPELAGDFMLHGSGGGEEASAALSSLVAPIRAVLLEMCRTRQVAQLPGLFGFIKVMRALGTDPDKDDILVKAALAGCPQDDLWKEVHGHLLAQGMTPVRFWFQGQQVNPLGPPPEPAGPVLPQLGDSAEGHEST